MRIVAGRGIHVCLTDDAPADKFDVVVECTGSASGLTTAMSLTRPRGTLVLKSTVAAGEALNLAPIVIDEISVVGSRCGPFPRALEALANGHIDVTPLVSDRYGLRDGVAAMARAATKGVIKVLLGIGDPLT